MTQEGAVSTVPAENDGSFAVCAGFRWRITSTLLGACLWLAAPFARFGEAPALGSIEHTFLFLPMVLAPLALLLLWLLPEPATPANTPLQRAVRHVQPIAAAMLLASFHVPKGALAAWLAGGWLLVTLLVALSGMRRTLHGRAQRLNVSLLAAHIFLPIGAVWLLMSRLGVGPRGFSELTVLLAALHFHFSGFTLQLLIAATRARLPAHRRSLDGLQRSLTLGAVAGIPIIAAGNLSQTPALKFLGVSLMVLSTLALAVTSAAVALSVTGRITRLLLLASSASLFAAMALAGIYGVGELAGRAWIGVPRMAALHGLLNGVGFTLCGLLGHLRLRLVEREGQRAAKLL